MARIYKTWFDLPMNKDGTVNLRKLDKEWRESYDWAVERLLDRGDFRKRDKWGRYHRFNQRYLTRDDRAILEEHMNVASDGSYIIIVH